MQVSPILQGMPIPKSKLSVNNNLFIDKPFVPSYQESLSINSKLRDMKKDYNDLELQIQSINNVMKKPKRPNSRRSKQLQDNKQRDRLLNSISNQNNIPQAMSNSHVNNSRLINKNRKNDSSNIENSMFTQQLEMSQSGRDPFIKKRMTWLKNEQVNLEKHSQMNYIFNHKIQQQNSRSVKNYNEMPNLKLENNHSGIKIVNRQVHQSSNIQNSRILNRGNNDTYNSSPQILKRKQTQRNQSDYAGAIRRRQQAKRLINARRDKLINMYRSGSGW